MTNKKTKLFLGCGPRPIHPQHLEIIDKDWTLIDLFVTAPGIVKMDARKLDYEDESVDEIYNSHLLEHLGLKEVTPTLKEWYRVLKKKGKLTINVPDMEYAAVELVRLALGDKPKSKVFDTPAKIMEIIYGNQDHEGEFHKCGFTREIIADKLMEAGFKIKKLDQVYEAHDMGCLIVEAIK